MTRRSSIRRAGNIAQTFSRIGTNDAGFTEREIIQVAEVNAVSLAE